MDFVEDQMFEDFWNLHSMWSQDTFGYDHVRNEIGPLKHLAKEVQEALEEQNPRARRLEIVDCFLLVCDAARRSGLSQREFLRLAHAKLAINQFTRDWVKNENPDEPTEHTRD